MAYIKPRAKYTTISVSEDLMNEIKKHISTHSDYSSVADFIKTSVRRQMEYDLKGVLEKMFDTPNSRINKMQEELVEIKQILIHISQEGVPRRK